MVGILSYFQSSGAHSTPPILQQIVCWQNTEFNLAWNLETIFSKWGWDKRIKYIEYHHNISALEDCLALTVQVFLNLILSLNEYVGVTKRCNVNLRKKNMPITVRADARVWYHRWYVCAWFRGPIQCMQNLTSSIAKSDIYHSKIWHLPLQNMTSTIAKSDIYHCKIWHLPLQNWTSTMAKSDIYLCKIWHLPLQNLTSTIAKLRLFLPT